MTANPHLDHYRKLSLAELRAEIDNMIHATTLNKIESDQFQAALFVLQEKKYGPTATPTGNIPDQSTAAHPGEKQSDQSADSET